MARPIKNGLDYFPFDVDFFSDKKIKRLRARFGTDGISVYMYLLCEIYRNGYYIEYDEDLILDISDELGLSEGSTTQIMNYLLSRSLLDDTLAKSVKVLTATSIQRRYQEAKKGGKRDVVVERDYWLLPKNETNSFIKVRPADDNSRNNYSFSENNSFNSEINLQSKVKESKVKESKVNVCAARGKHNNVNLTEEEYQAFVDEYGETVIDEYIERISEYVCGKKPYKNHSATLRSWLAKDGVKKQSDKPSFNLDLILQHAMENVPVVK